MIQVKEMNCPAHPQNTVEVFFQKPSWHLGHPSQWNLETLKSNLKLLGLQTTKIKIPFSSRSVCPFLTIKDLWLLSILLMWHFSCDLTCEIPLPSILNVFKQFAISPRHIWINLLNLQKNVSLNLADTMFYP